MKSIIEKIIRFFYTIKVRVDIIKSFTSFFHPNIFYISIIPEDLDCVSFIVKYINYTNGR